MNTVHTLRPEVSDEDILLRLSIVLRRVPFEFVFTYTHRATCVDFRVITHVHGGEGLSHNVGNPSIYLIVTRRDEASLLEVKYVADVKFGTTYIAMVQ